MAETKIQNKEGEERGAEEGWKKGVEKDTDFYAHF